MMKNHCSNDGQREKLKAWKNDEKSAVIFWSKSKAIGLEKW